MKRRILKNEGRPKGWFSVDGIISTLVKARIDEEKDLSENVVPKSEPTLTMSEFISKIKRENVFHSGATQSFLGRQQKKLKEILAYISEVRKKVGTAGCPPETGDLLAELTDWEPGAFKFGLDEETSESKRISLSICGPIEYYIETKRASLCELHSLIMKDKGGFLQEEPVRKSNFAISTEQRKRLQFLARQFEAGASRFPGLRHIVMSWPFMRLMPRPPKDEFPNFRFPENESERYYIFCSSFPTVLAKRETLTKEWYVPDGKLPLGRRIDWERDAGIARFRGLAQEAGQVAARAVFDYQAPILYQDSFGIHPDPFGTYGERWLEAIYLLRHVLCEDGWDGLFDEDSDFSHEGYKKGLYNFCESKDIFLDSVFVCEMLLSNAEPPTGETALPPSTFLSATDIANIRKVPAEALRKRLERYRKRHVLDAKLFIEPSDRGKKEPKYLYDVNYPPVEEIITELRNKKSSAKRPAKKN
ncbi:MAG TPA: hypothetical protein HPP87_12875 [Planctomycetes bacterium]|nr:hypothetical protein [Planctomycetota bacterium]